MTKIRLDKQNVAQTEQERIKSLEKLGANLAKARFIASVGRGKVQGDIRDAAIEEELGPQTPDTPDLTVSAPSRT